MAIIWGFSSSAGAARSDESTIVESEEVQPGVILDFNAAGKVVGLEIMNLSSRVDPARLRVIQVETS